MERPVRAVRRRARGASPTDRILWMGGNASVTGIGACVPGERSPSTDFLARGHWEMRTPLPSGKQHFVSQGFKNPPRPFRLHAWGQAARNAERWLESDCRP